MDAAIAASDAMLASAATQIDSDPFDRADIAQLVARRVLQIVEHAADEAITRTAGMGPARCAKTDGTLSGWPTCPSTSGKAMPSGIWPNSAGSPVASARATASGNSCAAMHYGAIARFVK